MNTVYEVIWIDDEWDNKPVRRICSYANESVYNNIIIPSSITYIDKYAFYQDEPFTYPQNYLYLFCEPTSRPETWDEEFYHNVSGVYWYSETAISDGQHWHYVGNVPTVW